ncbi:MAG: hypothetical protein DRN20_03595 [Thermoplasmata archaeon]|nr:MAG: hypothetical protein DRN20_03595 [Thermoplasmata archaeon]
MTVGKYKDFALQINNEEDEIKRWYDYIAEAKEIIRLEERLRTAEELIPYIDNTVAERKTKKRLYLPYLLPLFEAVLRGSLPAVPFVHVESSSQLGDKIAQLVRKFFSSPHSHIVPTSMKLQMDDFVYGIGIAKAVYKPLFILRYDQQRKYSDELKAEQLERIEKEHANPLSAQVAEDDMDDIHIENHLNYLDQVPLGTEEFEALRKHIYAHIARGMVFQTERFVLERIPPSHFIYDPTRPWHERAWEAELKIMRIKTLRQLHYRNVEPDNLEGLSPFTLKSNLKGAVPYEDMVAKIWDIHNFTTGERIVIPAENGRKLLHKGKWEYPEIDIYYPFVTRPFTHNPDQVHGLPTLQLAKPILDALATVEYYIREHIKRHPTIKIPMPKGMLTSVDKSKLNNPDLTTIELPPEVIANMHEIKSPPIPQSLIDYRQILLDQLRWIIGADPQDTGAPFPHRISATESSIRAGTHVSRLEDRRKTVGRMLQWAATTFLQLYRRFGQLQMTVKITDENGVSFQQIAPEDIPERIDLVVDIEAATKEAEAQRRETAIGVFNILKQATGVYPVDWNKAINWILRKFGIEDVSVFRANKPATGEIETAPISAGGAGGGLTGQSVGEVLTGATRKNLPEGASQWQNTQTSE